MFRSLLCLPTALSVGSPPCSKTGAQAPARVTSPRGLSPVQRPPPLLRRIGPRQRSTRGDGLTHSLLSSKSSLSCFSILSRPHGTVRINPQPMRRTRAYRHCRDRNPFRPVLHKNVYQRIVLATRRNCASGHYSRTRYFPHSHTADGYCLQVARHWPLQTRRISYVVDVSLAL